MEQDRRRRPIVVPEGPPPTGPDDAQAFFEAVNGARADDALVTLEVPAPAPRRSPPRSAAISATPTACS